MKWLLVLLSFTGCTHIHIDCPPLGTTHVMIGQTSAGALAVAALEREAEEARHPVKARLSPIDPPPAATIDYRYISLMAPGYIECGSGPVTLP